MRTCYNDRDLKEAWVLSKAEAIKFFSDGTWDDFKSGGMMLSGIWLLWYVRVTIPFSRGCPCVFLPLYHQTVSWSKSTLKNRITLNSK
jgi:hypothetical protein